MSQAINLRVYRRSQEDIILLWSTKGLAEEHKGSVEILVAENDEGTWRKVKFNAAMRDESYKMDKNTAIALIQCDENSLVAAQDYKFLVRLGKKQPIEARIDVFQFGVLPDQIKDDSKAIVQLYAYLKPKKRWEKVPMAGTKDGAKGLAVYVVNAEEIASQISDALKRQK